MKKLTQVKIAHLLNISAGNLNDILSCRRNASYKLAKKIVEKTNSSFDLWLCGGTGTPASRREAIECWAKGVI